MPMDEYVIKCLIPMLVFGALYGWFIAGPLWMNVTDDFFNWLDEHKK